MNSRLTRKIVLNGDTTCLCVCFLARLACCVNDSSFFFFFFNCLLLWQFQCCAFSNTSGVSLKGRERAGMSIHDLISSACRNLLFIFLQGFLMAVM